MSKRLRQCHCLRRNHAVDLSEDKLLSLRLNRLNDFGVAVPSVSYTDAGGEVGVARALGVIKVNTLAAHGLDVGEVGPNGGEVLWRHE